MTFLRLSFIFITVLFQPLNVFAQSYLPQFSNIDDAIAHCPGDAVVWVDATKATYRYQGAPKGVNTGGYVCKQEAANSGYSGLVTHLQPVGGATQNR